MQPSRGRAIAIALFGGLLFPSAAWGHGAHVLQAELREHPQGRYQLQLTLKDEVLLQSGPLTPTVPSRCDLTVQAPPRAAQQEIEPSTVLAFEFDCDAPALNPSDQLILPWPVGGGLVVAHWQDGTIEKQFYPPVEAGVDVAIAQLRPAADDRLPTLQADWVTGFRHGILSWAHLLFWFSILLWKHPKALLRLITVFSLGQILVVGVATVFPTVLATVPGRLPIAVGLTLATLWFVALARRGQGAAALPLWSIGGVGLLGSLHGWSWIGLLASPPLSSAALGVRLLAFTCGLDSAHLLLGACAWLGWRWRQYLPKYLSAYIPQNWRWRQGWFYGLAGLALWAGVAPFLPSSDERVEAQKQVVSQAPPAPTLAVTGPEAALQPQQVTLAAYVTIAPRTVRCEVLISGPMLQQQSDPQLRQVLQGQPIVEVEAQTVVKQRVGEWVQRAIATQINGQGIQPSTTEVNFVTADDTGIFIREIPIPEPIAEAVIGVVLTYPIEALPASLGVAWEGPFPSQNSFPLTITDPEQHQARSLTREQPVAVWQNRLARWTPAKITAVPFEPATLAIPVLALTLVGVALWIDGRQWTQQPTPRGGMFTTRLALSLALFVYPLLLVTIPLPLAARPSKTEIAKVLEQLLGNIYQAFDYPGEAAVYDQLAISIVGDQLTETYLESQQAFAVEAQGGTKAQVDQVDVTEIYDLSGPQNQEIVVQVEWRAGGAVSHFGHTHHRYNLYFAEITLTYTDQVWKIKDIALQDELRLL